MRYIILFIACFLFVIGVAAQPTITQFMNLDQGDKFWMKPAGKSINTSMITHGVNQIWDFSNLPTNQESIASICVEPSSTPYADSLEVQNSNMALKPYEADGDTIFMYQFFRLGEKNQESMALGMYHNYDKVSVNFTKWLDPIIGMKVPMTYGDSYSDRQILWMYNIALDAPIVRDTSEITVAVVGYGTLKTPAGTFENALLFKETINWIWWNNYGQEIYKTQGTDINYMWRVPGIKIGVMSVCIPNGESGNVSYLLKTEFNSGGIDNPDTNGNGGTGNGNGEPYQSNGTWLQTMSGGGGFFKNNIGSLNWTLGEVFSETFVVNPILTQGFNQPFDVAVPVVDYKMESEIKVYPNPINSELVIDIGKINEIVDAEIYSSTGQIMRNFKLTNPVNHLYLNEFKSGIYYLRINYPENPKTFKILKK